MDSERKLTYYRISSDLNVFQGADYYEVIDGDVWHIVYRLGIFLSLNGRDSDSTR